MPFDHASELHAHIRTCYVYMLQCYVKFKGHITSTYNNAAQVFVSWILQYVLGRVCRDFLLSTLSELRHQGYIALSVLLSVYLHAVYS